MLNEFLKQEDIARYSLHRPNEVGTDILPSYSFLSRTALERIVNIHIVGEIIPHNIPPRIP